MIEARAHGKLILFGEHAVVYGTEALVAGMNLGLRATLRAGQEAGIDRCTVAGRSIRLEKQTTLDESGADLGALAFAALLGVDRGLYDLDVDVDGALPAGMGLGFSAAAGVAIARGLELLLAQKLGAPVASVASDAVLSRALAWERVFHGDASGIDVAAAIGGGVMTFSRATGAEPLELSRGLSVCIGLTGVASSTKVMVEQVARSASERPAEHAEVVGAIAALVGDARRALLSGDLQSIGRLMNTNQEQLARWKVSTAAIESLCASARKSGALGAKLTGAGGGGAVVALVPDHRPEVAEAVVAGWKALGYVGWQTHIGATGGASTPAESTAATAPVTTEEPV